MKQLKKIVKLVVIILFLFVIGCKQTSNSKEDTKTVISESSINKNSVKNKDSVKNIEDTIQKNTCIVESNYLLPYNQKIDIKSVKYSNLNCNISGLDDFLCGKKNIRYISLPNFSNVNVILVPMDCGDFKYRFFLLTIFKSKIVSKQYVEGEWFEPEDDSYKENTSFSITKDYIISITTNAIENGKSTLKEELKFKILDNGFLEKAR